MRVLLAIVFVIAIASLLYLGLQAYLIDRARRPGPYRVQTITRDDGTLAVIVRRGTEHARTVRELPADLDPIDLQAELRLARDEAQLVADELNRGV